MKQNQPTKNQFIINNKLQSAVNKLRHSGMSYRERADYINKKYLANSKQKIFAMTILRWEQSHTPMDDMINIAEFREYMKSDEFMGILKEALKGAC